MEKKEYEFFGKSLHVWYFFLRKNNQSDYGRIFTFN